MTIPQTPSLPAADYNLIEAAPDMLAALHELLKWWGVDDMDAEVYDAAEKQARAAIAKATGAQS